jgi:1-acyl-sn-glycerol-3-phosphate acyltransferase
MWAKLRSAYAWVLLSVIMLPLFPVAALFRRATARIDPRRDRLRRLVASWVSVYGRLTPLYRYDVRGVERLSTDRPYVMVANHESGLDALSLLMLRTPVRFIAEDYLFALPLAGWLFRMSGQIPVKIGDRESGAQALERAERALADGTPVAFFPEGHLSLDGMAEFKPGAFVLARRARVPIYPVLLEGAGVAWRPGTLVVKGRHRIGVTVLDPIDVDEIQRVEPNELAVRTRKHLQALKGESGPPPR